MSDIQGVEPPDTSPDNAIPIPEPTASCVPSVQTLHSWLPLYLKKADRTINCLSEILSTPSGTDALLCTLCYASLLSSSVLTSISLHQLHKAARRIIERAIALPPDTTVIIHTSAIPTSRLLITSQRLKALSDLISDFRIFVRLWGLIGIWKWGKSLLENPPGDVVIKKISYARVIVNIFFQCLENAAYLSSKGVFGWSTEKQTKAYILSSQFWMVDIGLDFLRLYREYSLRKQRGTEEEKRKDGPKGDVITDREDTKWEVKWRRELILNLAWAPLTLHWSLEKGLVSSFWVGLLGSVAGGTGLRELWKNTTEI